MPRLSGGTKKQDLRRQKSRRNASHFWPRLRIAGGIFAALLLVALPLYAFTSGWIGRQGDRLLATTARAGLALTEVYTLGRIHTDPKDIMAALDFTAGQPTLAYNVRAARRRLEALPWVKAAAVQRRFPDTLMVNLTERQPFAFWQQGGKLALVDETGVILTDEKLGRFAGLPQVVGERAPEAAPELFAALAHYPEISQRLKAAVFVGDRRWNLRLHNGIEVRLPEGNLEDALARLAAAEAEGQLLEKDIVVIDLRLSDRLVVETSPAAAARQKAPKEGI